jgi:sugar phosphate isomerase/epimerase
VPPLAIAISLSDLRLPLKRGLAAARRLGAQAVEIDARGELRPGALSETGLRELRMLLNELDLRVASIAFQTRRGYDVADQLERRIAATKEAMKFAYRLGAPVVVNQVGRVPAESSGPIWTGLIEVLSELAEHSQRAGARLAAQTGTESGADLARLLAALPPQGIGVDFDPGGLLVNGFSPSEAIEVLAPNVLQLRVRDAAEDIARGRGLEVPLGRGSVDFPAILGVLEERGFRGTAVIARPNSTDPEGEIGAAVEYLKSL